MHRLNLLIFILFISISSKKLCAQTKIGVDYSITSKTRNISLNFEKLFTNNLYFSSGLVYLQSNSLDGHGYGVNLSAVKLYELERSKVNFFFISNLTVSYLDLNNTLVGLNSQYIYGLLGYGFDFSFSNRLSLRQHFSLGVNVEKVNQIISDSIAVFSNEAMLSVGLIYTLK